MQCYQFVRCRKVFHNYGELLLSSIHKIGFNKLLNCPIEGSLHQVLSIYQISVMINAVFYTILAVVFFKKRIVTWHPCVFQNLSVKNNNLRICDNVSDIEDTEHNTENDYIEL